MATLTPSFREFLPPWVAAQSWYQGSRVPVLSLVGSYRFEDPNGEVGIETHLLSDGTATYQVPMTYRGAPLADSPDARTALIATAEHSELGTRWIYDATADHLWREELTRLVRNSGACETKTPDGLVITTARGRPLNAAKLQGEVTIDLRRRLFPGPLPDDAAADGLLEGTWHAIGRGASRSEAVTGCLAVLSAQPL